jgi:plasmid stabilization system protein ParE
MRVLRWTIQAESDFTSTVLYLDKEWGKRSAINLINRVDRICQIIQNQPFLFPLVPEYSNIRKCFVNRHVTLYFRMQNPEDIEILAFWNNRKNPEKLDFE